jgi:hypothetical protein
MAAKRYNTEAPIECRYDRCPRGGEISLGDQREAVRTLAGMMHRACWQNMQAAIAERMAAAVAAGTHTTEPPKTLCAGCRELKVAYTGDAQSRSVFCFECYLKGGGLQKATHNELVAWQRENPVPGDPSFPSQCEREIKRRADARAKLMQFAQRGR